MIIEIRNDIFDNIDNFKSLNKLLQDITYNRRYDLFIDIEELNENLLFNRIDIDDRQIIEEYFDRQITENKTIDYYVSTKNNDSDFNLEEAIRFFNEPVLIILENNLNDAYFIDALIEHFRKKSKKIKRHKDANWLKYENSGGANNIPNTITSILNCFQHLPKENHKYLRAIVVIDSDREYPNMSLKNDKQKIIDFCNQNEIKIHVLEKREMENYLPDEVVDDIADKENDSYLKAYLNLNPTQKDYFDLEKGFPDKNQKSFSGDIEKLYYNVDNEDYKILRKGMINEKFKKKSEFPKLFKHKNVTQQNLLNRVKHQKNNNELQEILSKINELL